MTPFAKTGGLADVVGALPGALAELGHEVMCCLPFYRCAREAASDARPVGLTFQIPVGDRTASGEVWECRSAQGVRVLFVRRDEYYDRAELYQADGRDYEDNAERFLFFSKAVAELAGLAPFQPDVVHCHDWQTGFVPALMSYRRQVCRTVFTIHNIAYQGSFPASDFALTNLPGTFFTPDGLEFYGRMNLLKAGIVFADAVTTVSKRYAKEILTPEFGAGLDPVLKTRQDDLTGIINGADYRTWDPATDAALKRNYSLADISGKQDCRQDLAERLGLDAASRAPIAGFISRLAEQKGVDLLVAAMDDLFALGVRLAVLGRGDSGFEQALAAFAKKRPGQVAFVPGHNEELAHQIQAGADMFLVPSRFEPCGLTQMYALKYGTIPVVRATGGLDDTVTQFDPQTGEGTGFKFAEYSPAALIGAVRQAVAVFRQPKRWRRLMENAMACDFSWLASARQYERLYTTL
jgi:starch synthase